MPCFACAKNVILVEILIKRVVVGADPYGENLILVEKM